MQPPPTGATEPPPAAAQDAAPSECPPSRLTRTFQALQDPNFRLLYVSNILQFGSMQMQLVVRGWLVFHLTGSFAALGAMALATAIPLVLLSPIGGVVADRTSKKTVIQLGQGYNAVNAAVLAVLVGGWLGLELEFWHLFLSAFLQGAVNSIMQPARQSMVSDLVPRERLTNAIGINASGQTLMQLVGPGIAGLMIAAVSPATVFATMAAMYALAITFTMRLPSRPLYAFARPQGGAGGAHGARRGRGAGGLKDLADGMRYVTHDPTIRTVIAVNFLIVIVVMPYTMLLPGFVKEVLQRGAFEQGVLQSVQGIGALIGAMGVASTGSRGRGRLFIGCGVLLGAGIVAFSASTNYWVTLPLMVLIGAGQAGRMAFGQVLIQAYSAEEYRGRVMSVWFMEFGLVQFGTFIVGFLAEWFGPQLAIGGLAATLLVGMAAVALFVPTMRQLE
ncbi:MAG: MFS transporter [Chloroflexi bacterium]|nr:MFS transporter [Chloroflexota bacterium]